MSEKEFNFRVTVYDVAEWRVDEHELAGLESHVGHHDALSTQLHEEDEKTESDRWKKEHLPFVFTMKATIPIDDDPDLEPLDDATMVYDREDEISNDIVCDVLDRVSEELCYGDILQPEELDWHWELIREDK